jgi:hypothetical protein
MNDSAKPRYYLSLPVWEQDDDINSQLAENKGDVYKALSGLSEQYELAAGMINHLANLANEHPEITVEGEDGFILVTGPEDALAGMIEDEVLVLDTGDEIEDDSHECCAGCGKVIPDGEGYLVPNQKLIDKPN